MRTQCCGWSSGVAPQYFFIIIGEKRALRKMQVIFFRICSVYKFVKTGDNVLLQILPFWDYYIDIILSLNMQGHELKLM